MRPKCRTVTICRDGYTIHEIRRCTDCKTTYDRDWNPVTIFSKTEMEVLKELSSGDPLPMHHWTKPFSMTDREWEEFLGKLS